MGPPLIETLMSKHQHAIAPAEVIDPVCGMTIRPEDAVGHIEHHGQTYYFCSQSCLERFRATPEQFVKSTEKPVPARVGPGAEYTCPMHPEVRQQGPGSCPKCGMSRPYAIVGALGERQFGRIRLFINGENLTGVRQTRWGSLIRPSQAPDGRWTVDAWAPLEGRNVNGGVRVRF